MRLNEIGSYFEMKGGAVSQLSRRFVERTKGDNFEAKVEPRLQKKRRLKMPSKVTKIANWIKNVL